MSEIKAFGKRKRTEKYNQGSEYATANRDGEWEDDDEDLSGFAEESPDPKEVSSDGVLNSTVMQKEVPAISSSLTVCACGCNIAGCQCQNGGSCVNISRYLENKSCCERNAGCCLRVKPDDPISQTGLMGAAQTAQKVPGSEACKSQDLDVMAAKAQIYAQQMEKKKGLGTVPIKWPQNNYSSSFREHLEKSWKRDKSDKRTKHQDAKHQRSSQDESSPKDDEGWEDEPYDDEGNGYGDHEAPEDDEDGEYEDEDGEYEDEDDGEESEGGSAETDFVSDDQVRVAKEGIENAYFHFRYVVKMREALLKHREELLIHDKREIAQEISRVEKLLGTCSGAQKSDESVNKSPAETSKSHESTHPSFAFSCSKVEMGSKATKVPSKEASKAKSRVASNYLSESSSESPSEASSESLSEIAPEKKNACRGLTQVVMDESCFGWPRISSDSIKLPKLWVGAVGCNLLSHAFNFLRASPNFVAHLEYMSVTLVLCSVGIKCGLDLFQTDLNPSCPRKS